MTNAHDSVLSMHDREVPIVSYAEDDGAKLRTLKRVHPADAERQAREAARAGRKESSMKPVLVATHLRPQAVAAQLRGAALARAMKAPLQLLHVLPPFSSKRAQSSAKAQVRLAAARLRQAFDVRVHAALAQGLVASSVARQSREVDARVIVMGVERPSLVDELRPGRVHAVRQRAEVPVLAVSRGRDETYRRIVLASDLCTDDASALAALHRQFPDAALHVVHVLQWHVSRPLRHVFIADEVLARYRAQVRERATSRLRRVAQARHDAAPTVSVEATIKDLTLALRVQARQFGADLLVLSPEQSWLKAALGISVAQRVLADPPCDVLLLPRASASEALELPAAFSVSR